MKIEIGDIYKFSGDEKCKPVVFRIESKMQHGYTYTILNHPDEEGNYTEIWNDIFWIVTSPNQLDKYTMEKLVNTLDKISEREALAWCI